MPEYMTERLPKISRDVRRYFRKDARSQRICHVECQSMPDRMQNMPEGMPERMLERMAEDRPVRMPLWIIALKDAKSYVRNCGIHVERLS